LDGSPQHVVLGDEQEVVDHVQGQQYRGIRTHGDAGRSSLDRPEGGPADTGPLGDQGDRELASEPGEFDLLSHHRELSFDRGEENKFLLGHNV